MNNTNSSWLDRFFKLSQYNTNVKTEIIAGLTTFVTMAYIIVVQPDLMKAAGMDQGAVMVTVLIASGLFSIIMGLYAKRPFAVAPGMGGNAFFAYSIVAAGLATWQQGLGMIFISGVLFLLLTFLGLRETISHIIPKNIKHAIGAAVGLFIIGTGFSNAKLIVQNKTGTLTLGSLHSPTVLLSVIGLVIIIGLMARKLKAAVFIGILITSIIGIPMGITKLPHSFGDLFSLPPNPSSIMFQADIPGALKLAFFPLLFTFFTGEFFSTMGTVLGVGAKANLLDKDGNLPDIKKPFIVDGVATVGGALMGQTTITTYIESASGVEAGGRTGLTAVTTGIVFLLALFITPIILLIPSAATAPALIVIGLSMLATLKNINMDEWEESLPALLTVIAAGLTFSLANGIVFGILSYVVIKVFLGKFRDIHIGLWILCVPLVYYLWLK
ncbi:NCS2 family permease [Paenibacillus dokdonensis]|uniref:NCS2 family permease n=1 Tax=Paenibacillus dokdonensis TaxID=2567944 RepID=UPI0010A7E6CD|nr:NCS2 family permease [Paenibacillus dokdonensis]